VRWRKLGRVYAPGGDLWWARSHAFIPTADVRDDGIVRVYVTGLDEARFGRVGYVDVDASDPTSVRHVSPEPVLDLGPLGAFDDSGVNASAVVPGPGASRRLYYIGWQRAERVPYMLFTGLAESPDGARPFERVSPVPVLDRTPEEPFSRSAPCVLAEGAGFRAWYWSCERWTRDGDWVHYNNVIRTAVSADGVRWESDPKPCVVPGGDDYSVGRPWVVRDPDAYRMWYSIRSRTQPYRLGYAESADGVRWVRRDDAVGLDRSADGWDSEMVCFPCVVDAGGRRLMFYNGNRHGATGFGVAVLDPA
jgi:hypothetical protein